MKRFVFVLTLLLFAGFSLLHGQGVEVTGTVTSAEDGAALPGVSVVVQGTTIGAVTDFEGNYSITVPDLPATLMFSFVGMLTQEVQVEGDRTQIDVVLEPTTLALDEVVVTALGVSREKKSLGYAVQEVDGDAVSQVKTNNLVNSLSGKLAGVHVKVNNNIGGSTNVIIRGSSSLTQNNQALFVVDGVPVSNSIPNESGQVSGRSGFDYGNVVSDLNPNDIESISVLKGAAATALYGSRAANGVILITTKKGKRGRELGVTVNSNVTISQVDPSTFPKHQKLYGAGYDPTWYSSAEYPGLDEADIDDDGTAELITPFYEDASRGQRLDENLLVYQWDAFDPESPNFMTATPYVAGENGAETFMETGVSYTNSVEVSGGGQKSTYRMSYTNLDQKGIMPNSSLKRNNFNFNGSYQLLKNLKVSSSVNYIITKGKGRNHTGYSDNIMSSFRQWYQANVDLALQKQLYDETGRNITWNRVSWDDGTPIYWDNPYWARYENYETDQRNRLIGYVRADWEITDYLSIMGRVAADSYSELQEERKAVGSVAGEFGVDRPDVTSGYSRMSRDFIETNMDLMARFNKNLGENVSLSALLGTNIRRNTIDRVFASTNNGLAVPGIYALSNSADPMLPPEERFEQIGVNGIFGNVSVGLGDLVYIEGTLRRDQSSTLPEENNAYLYPSISGSFLFNNLFEANWLQLGKVRLNYAEVGASAPPLRVTDTYRGKAPFSGNSMVEVYHTKNNPDLLPERTKSLEAGLEMTMFGSRLGFDFAVYKTNTVDQLMPVDVSYATGYRAQWVNAGEIENKGIELNALLTPVRTSSFNWDIGVNWAKNVNKVISLYVDEAGNEVQNLRLAALQGGISINARVGEPYGAITGIDYVYHENGEPIVRSDGYYQKTSTSDQVIGNFNPDWIGGINNAFSYKDFTLSFLVDFQRGGQIFSLDQWYGVGTGMYEETADNNDLGNQERLPVSEGGGIILPGVQEDGTPNDVRIESDIFAQGWVMSPNAQFVYDANYIKLRELVFTYNLPQSLMDRTPLYGASVSFVGSNLWIIQKDLPHADPEATQGAGNVQGWQSGVMPTTRNLGFSINLQF